MRKKIYSLLFVCLIIFIENICFADYNNLNQGSYCSEAEYNRFLNEYNILKSQYEIYMSNAQTSSSLSDIDKYVEKFEKETKNQMQKMQEANPYAQLGKMAPLNIDEDAYVEAAKLNNYAQANANALNPQSFTPRDFQAEQMRVAQARQLAQVAKQTGLTTEQFMQGAALDYNTTGKALENQQNFVGNIYIQGANYDISARNQFYNNANFYIQQMQHYQELMIQCLNNMRRQ